MNNNLTDAEITIKALKKLLEVMLSEGDLQRISTISHTIDLINRQKEENEELNKDLADTIALNYKERKGLKAEIERLKENLNIELENYATEYDNKIKAEAYKECIEKVKEKSCKLNMCHNDVVVKTDYQISGENLDNLLKELVGK